VDAQGILNLYKPPGPTSHDCVNRVRRALRLRRVGHAGTLDPMACGVLLVGVGGGTRILQYLQPLRKVYRACLSLGWETDTQDATGAVVQEGDASGVTHEQFDEALTQLVGEQLQAPPMYSAVKVGGKRLYELARRGETVPRDSRGITVYGIECLRFMPGQRAESEIRVTCSAGTYIRTLCHDLGQVLGTGGVMTALEREAIGHFRSDQAVSLDTLGADTPLLPLADALAHLPALTVGTGEQIRLAHGQFIPVPEETPEGLLRLLAEDGALVALGSVRGHGAARLVAPEKVFVTANAASLRA